MRWDVAVAAWLVPITADSVVTGLLGADPQIDLVGERDHVIPSLEYTLIVPAQPFLEVYWRTLVQLDFWLDNLPDLLTLEKALVRLLHFDTPETFGVIPMWSQMISGGGELPGSKDGVRGRSLDFHLIYLRGKYS